MDLQQPERRVDMRVLMTGVALALAAPVAHSASVIGTLTLQSTTQLVTTGTTTVFSADYVLPTSGTLRVTLTDNDVGATLSQLDFSLLRGALSSSARLSSPVSAIGNMRVWTFDVTAGHYAALFQASAGALNGAPGFFLGQYSDTVVFTPAGGAPSVPLPPAGTVLLGGLGTLAVLAGRSRRKAPAPVC